MKTRLSLLCLMLLVGTVASAQWPLPGCPVPSMNSGGVPDYMSGCVGNYANSPLPAVSGGVTGLTLLSGGSGYSNPTVAIDLPASGTQAIYTANIVNGVITGFTKVQEGSGYTVVPNVTITDPTGTGATATAVVPVVPGTGMRKFVDSLSLPGVSNNLGQTLPVAVPDTITFPGSDYYEIDLVEYQEQLHSDLAPTTLRGYVQVNYGTDGNGSNTIPPTTQPQYLGPVIVAQQDRPVRIKFTNRIAIVANGGNLFIPTDTSVMGAGAPFTQNRATLHLHGGNTPWISDGTPHQWTVPVGETAGPDRGVSTQTVPDMYFVNGVVVPQCSATVTTNCSPSALPAGASNDPGQGSLTFYYTNQQSARLMFYHDHAYGITRLNVYAGEAAGYLLRDPIESILINGGTITPPGQTAVAVSPGTIPAAELPLVIQDKSFVPPAAQLAAQDPTWMWGPKDGNGNFIVGSLWFPHVYMPNQNPYALDNSGANPMGRWDYGLWFWPPMDPASLTGAGAGEVACPSQANPAQMCPGIPNPSLVPEAFMDSVAVNGTVFPYVEVQPQAYRLRILNAANDRMFNLQLYQAWDAASGALCAGLAATPSAGSTAPSTCTEVKFVPPPDGIAGQGPIPDPATVGPSMIQIGTEGGFLPFPVVLPNTPISYNYNRRDIVVLNVQNKNLFLGPAERADVIVDFSGFAGKTLIMYNDAPAPVPAFDTRIDYYTGAPDQTDTGGAPTIMPGYGPNTRTIMQIKVAAGTPIQFNQAPLGPALAAAFAASQPVPITPESAYGPIYNQTYPNVYSRIQSTSLTYTPLNADGTTQTQITQPITRKAIQELFEMQYARMNATLGVELPFTNFNTQTTIPLGYIDPATELVNDGETQIWKITHNGVDTHAIHFHLFNVQLINRVGWDGAIRPPDANELGWKETVRMNPLEDAIVALKPVRQSSLPFGVPDSYRPLDVTMPANSTITVTNPADGNPTTVTNWANFGWEYVWHCHLLGHEENDMMRPIVFHVALPTVGATVSPLPNLAGWNNTSPVTVTITAVDAAGGPGIQSITYSASGAQPIALTTVNTNPASISISTNGTTTISFYATNLNGVLSTTETVTVNLDTILPTLTWGVASPAANGAGWNNTNVSVPFTPADTLSGVASTVPAASPLVISTEGSAVTGTASVTDVAGNLATFTSPSFNIDKTAPVTTSSLAGTLGTNGWYKSAVTVTLTASDALSGVAATYYTVNGGAPQSYAAPFSLSSNGTYALTYWSVDVAGNAETPNSATIKIDTIAPTLTWSAPSPAANGFGWNNTAVSIAYTTADNLSGVASASPPSPLSFVSQGANQTQSVTVTDNAGNTALFTSPAVNIDLTAPTLTAAANPPSAKAGKGNVNVNVTGTVSDALSGVNLSSGSYTVVNGAGTTVASANFTIAANLTYSFKVSLSTTGKQTYTITVRANDKAGNTGSAQTTFAVR